MKILFYVPEGVDYCGFTIAFDIVRGFAESTCVKLFDKHPQMYKSYSVRLCTQLIMPSILEALTE